jgi:hypothetical protein
MLVATCCHFFVHNGPIYIFAVVVGILLLVGSVIAKFLIDNSYKRALSELATGTLKENNNIMMNPARFPGKYESNKTKSQKTMYDLND